MRRILIALVCALALGGCASNRPPSPYQDQCLLEADMATANMPEGLGRGMRMGLLAAQCMKVREQLAAGASK